MPSTTIAERNEEIRARRRENDTLRELAKEYSLSASRVAKICVGIVPPRVDPELRSRVDQEIRRLRGDGVTYQAIADHLGISLNRAFKVARYVETPTQRVQREMSSVPT